MIFSLTLCQNVRFLLRLRQTVLINNTYGPYYFTQEHELVYAVTQLPRSKIRIQCFRKLGREKKNLSWFFRGNLRIIRAMTETWTCCFW